MRGNENRGQAQFAQEERSMQRARTPERDERVVARIDAAFHGHAAKRSGRLRKCHGDDAAGGLTHRQPQCVAHALDRLPGAADVERQPPGQGRIGAQRADRHVGVRECRLFTPQAVRGGPGTRPRALRPDVEAGSVDPREASPSRTGRHDVDGRTQDRVVLHDLDRAHRRRSVVHQADVQRGPAHVERDQPAEAVTGAERDGARHARDGPREQQPVSLPLRPVGRNAPTVRLHDEERRARAQGGGLVARVQEVATHHRAQPGAQGSGRRARILPELPGDLGGQRDRNAGEPLLYGGPHRPLVPVVEITEEESDRQGLRLPPGNLVDHTVHLIRAERVNHLSLAGQSLARLDAVPSRHQFGRPVRGEAVEVGPAPAPVAQRVAESLGRHEDGARKPVGQDGVRRHRGPVEQQRDPFEVDA